MSVGTESRAAAIEGGDAMDSRLGVLLLYAIDAYESQNENGPTVPELAADLGITRDFGHSHLVAHLQREQSLGHVSHYGGRFKLTRAERSVVEYEIGTSPSPAAAGRLRSGIAQ